MGMYCSLQLSASSIASDALLHRKIHMRPITVELRIRYQHTGKFYRLSVMSRHTEYCTYRYCKCLWVPFLPKKVNTLHMFLIYRCTWGPSLTMTPPRMTSSHAKRQVWSFKPVTSFRSSTSRIRTGGKAELIPVLLTSLDWYPPQSSKNGKLLCHTIWWGIPQYEVTHQPRPQSRAKNVPGLTWSSFPTAGGWQVKARPERAVSPAARLGRKRSAKTSTWRNTALVSVPLDVCCVSVGQ